MITAECGQRNTSDLLKLRRLATICRGSKAAAVAVTWISNPFTYVPLFVFNYKIGKLLLRTKDSTLPPLDIESLTEFKELN